MIKTICTCDKCGGIIGHNNELPPAVIIYATISKYTVDISWHAQGACEHLCLYCFIDAVNALDDRKGAVP